ncbi:MAG TPA: urease accessory UreF family protein [Polyangia bacterium]|jgi:urease accessory protein|nr:urease accessory UreF family protein [Polyangia bacterium]
MMKAPLSTEPSPRAAGALGEAALLRLLQLCSPALPIGAFAYSQALEPAVAAGWVCDEATAIDWISGLLEGSLTALDLPIVERLHAAWSANDVATVDDWTALLAASRSSRELQAEERHLGAALARVLDGVGIAEAAAWTARADVTYAAMFALAASRWGIPVAVALSAYAFVWCETQVSAAVRLIPLGQSAGQRVLSALSATIPACVVFARAVADHDIGAAAPSHAIASAVHETQYSRLFRS